ncbi:MAG: LysM peptidoglycan-binding domain-containing protein [Bryobacterales bacterium]|nr:LysM peptidoglycan-binding domain-containing protein [Bryobacterales bacterium]
MLEEKPTGQIKFPPTGGDPYHVRTGDSWESIAKANSLSVWALIEFNFPVIKSESNFQRKCRMVNWLLKTFVGCTKTSDGKNYRFDGTDRPGVIYIPLFDIPPVYTHRVNLHFRSLSLTDVPFDRIFRAIQRAYAPHGIQMQFASGSCLRLSAADAARYASVSGSCEWKITSGEFAEIQRLGSPIPPGDIAVYFVKQFDSATLRGCGGHVPERNACIVASMAATYSTAHEIGHVLLGSGFAPVHDVSTSNLMYQYENPIGDPPGLNAAQVTRMKSSICCKTV